MIKQKVIYSVTFLVIISFTLFGCKQQKQLSKTTENVCSFSELKSDILKKSESIKRVSIKGIKISIDDNSALINLKANILISKDSAILVSLSNMLGIEISRILFQPDNIILVDRINKTYKTGTYNDIYKKYNFSVNYYLLQSILFSDYSYIFNTYNYMNTSDTIKSKFNNYEINFSSNEKEINNIILFIDSKNENIIQAVLRSKENNQDLKIEYISYINYKSIYFPEIIDLDFKSKKTNLTLTLKNGTVNFQANTQIKLDIPKNYNRGSLND